MLVINNIYEINYSDEVYPKNLKLISNPPKKLYAIGNLSVLNSLSVGIVGSRNSSSYGELITEKITKELVENNITIVSGMAVGIDSVAHKTCLKNKGKTIAVIGSGFKHIYPKENIKLFDEIIKNGGIVLSEYPPDTPVQMKNFPRRNRILSGISSGVLVIEAAYRSGTSITAKLAKAQGKKVFCIPNCIGNKNSYGTIELIKKGAILIKDGQDILKELNINVIKEPDYKEKKILKEKQIRILDDNSKKIVDCVRENKGLDAEGISVKTKLNICVVNQILTMLEIEEILIFNGKSGYDVVEAYYE